MFLLPAESQHKDHFAKLIADMKKRGKNKKAEQKQDEGNSKTGGDDVIIIDSENEVTCKNTKDVVVASIPPATETLIENEICETKEHAKHTQIECNKDSILYSSELTSTVERDIPTGGSSSMLSVPPVPTLPANIDMYDESTDEGEVNFGEREMIKLCDISVGGDDTRIGGDDSLPGGSSGSESPSILDPVPLTQRLVESSIHVPIIPRLESTSNADILVAVSNVENVPLGRNSNYGQI